MSEMKFKVKELADKQGWTLTDLAKRANLMPITIYPLWANDGANPLLSTLNKIADALGVPVENLIDKETK